MPRRYPRKPFPQRVAGSIESMIPGTVGGRVANASPVRRSVDAERPSGAASRPSVVFSLPGSVAASTSGPWVADAGTTLVSVRALLGTAGSSSTTVVVKVNGTSVGTVTLASGDTSERADINAALVADTDVVTMAVTAAGTGAADLTVIARFA